MSADPKGLEFPWRPLTLRQVLGGECGVLRGKQGDVEATALKGQFLGLYFSAHWCPPCR